MVIGSVIISEVAFLFKESQMTELEKYLADLASTGKYGQIPTSDNGLSKPVKIVKMTPLENTDGSGIKRYIIQALDQQGAEYLLKVAS